MNKPVASLIEGKPVLIAIDVEPQRAPRVASLIAAARAHLVPVVFATHVSRDERTAFDRQPGTYAIRYRRLSVFYGTELSILLRELEVATVILAAGITSTSVHYSFLDAHQHDYFCRVVEDCVAGASPRAHAAALRAMEYMQTGACRSCDAVIAALAAGAIATSRRAGVT